MDKEIEEVFPAEDGLFEEGFCKDSVYSCCGEECRIKENFSSRLGVSASVWDSAIHLCRFFERTSLELRGKRIIELGAGTGVVSILAARLGACVTVTDLPVVIPHLLLNIERNTPPGGWPSLAPNTIPLSWGRNLENVSSDWDLVLGTDIVYLPQTFPLLLDTLVHLSRNGAVVFLSSKMRREHGTQEFYEDWLPQNFDVELVQREPENNINIYRAVLRVNS